MRTSITRNGVHVERVDLFPNIAIGDDQRLAPALGLGRHSGLLLNELLFVGS